MNTEKEKILNIFKKNLLNFFDELSETFRSEGKLIFIRVFIDSLENATIMDMFNQKILPKKELIEKRDETFILQNPLLEFIEDDKEIFSRIWKESDKQEREAIWKWFDIFIALVNKYNS